MIALIRRHWRFATVLGIPSIIAGVLAYAITTGSY